MLLRSFSTPAHQPLEFQMTTMVDKLASNMLAQQNRDVSAQVIVAMMRDARFADLVRAALARTA